VYDELLPGERNSLHRAFAEALVTQVPEAGASEAGHWAELAHHWAAAREDRQAFEASLRAAAAAMSSFAFGAALQAYERGLLLWDGLTEGAALAGFDRVELLRRAGRAAYLAGDYRRSVAHRREAVAGAEPTVDPVRAGILREELGRALYVLGDPSASLEAYRDAVATIPAEPPTPERARALSGLGQILMLLDRFAESRGLCEEAISIARAVGARAQEGHALNTLGRDRSALGDCDAGIAELEEALRIALEVHSADDIGRAYVNLAEALDDCGETDRAVEVTNEGIRVAEEIGVGHSYGQYIRLGGVAFAYALGQWDEAARFLDEATARAGTGLGPDLYRLSNSLPLLVGQGSVEAADAGLSRAFELIDEVQGAQFAGPVHAASAERALWRHEPRAALEMVERGLERLAGTDDRTETAQLCRIGAWAAADLADVARAVRDEAAVAEARARLGQLSSRLDQTQQTVTAAAPSRELATDRATLEVEARRLERQVDPDAWRGVADGWADLKRPYLAAYARWRQGEAAIAMGDRVAATKALQAAALIAARLGARPLREAIEALAHRARISPSPPAPSDEELAPARKVDGFGLTPREREVLALVADGRTNRQIAETLFIAESTAGVHVSNILGKLGVANRGEAAAVAFRLGLVSEEPKTGASP
jgi:DNA-binding CsgD family transcriptional regulator/tetratricopeptide (TPR) repeat protein